MPWVALFCVAVPPWSTVGSDKVSFLFPFFYYYFFSRLCVCVCVCRWCELTHMECAFEYVSEAFHVLASPRGAGGPDEWRGRADQRPTALG